MVWQLKTDCVLAMCLYAWCLELGIHISIKTRVNFLVSPKCVLNLWWSWSLGRMHICTSYTCDWLVCRQPDSTCYSAPLACIFHPGTLTWHITYFLKYLLLSVSHCLDVSFVRANTLVFGHSCIPNTWNSAFVILSNYLLTKESPKVIYIQNFLLFFHYRNIFYKLFLLVSPSTNQVLRLLLPDKMWPLFLYNNSSNALQPCLTFI